MRAMAGLHNAQARHSAALARGVAAKRTEEEHLDRLRRQRAASKLADAHVRQLRTCHAHMRMASCAHGHAPTSFCVA